MTYIKAIALRAFRYSEDGINAIHVSDHETFDCPEHLFEGLNNERYVRRAEIGDGHVTLETGKIDANAISAKDVILGSITVDGSMLVAAADATGEVSATDLSDSAETENAAPEPSVASDGTIPAPQPASRTSELAADVLKAIKDGSWREWRFFKQRSVAAKLSTQPIINGPDAVAVLEAEATRLAGE